MNGTKTILAALTALTALGACGNSGQSSPLLQIAGAAVPGVAGALGGLGGGGDDAAAAAPTGFDATTIAANPGAFQLIGVATLFPLGLSRALERTGDDVTWESQYGYTAAFEGGVLVATRGLGDDLMAANVDGTRRAIAAGGGQAVRVHETLDGLDQIVSVQYQCRIERGPIEQVNLGIEEVPGRRFAETCVGGGVQFENLYWTDQSGRIFASRQFISPTVAYLRSNRI